MLGLTGSTCESVAMTGFVKPYRSASRILSPLVLVAVAAAAAADGGWPNRFGPLSNGHIPAEDAVGIPVHWNEASGYNLIWKTRLSDFGHSTPAILNGKIWFTSAAEDGRHQYLDCVDQSTGDLLHHRLLFENLAPEPLGNPVNTYASPSCVVTDDAVFVHFGTYGTGRVDAKSLKVVWQRRDIRCRHFRGPGSSPVLFDNLLILTFDGIDAQFLTALNADTGETVWRTKRSTDYEDLDENGRPHRDGDLRKAFSTPVLVRVNRRTQVVSVGSRAAFGYDATTGSEIWTIRHDDYNAAAPPSVFRDTAILNTGSRSSNLIAVRLDESTVGDVTDSHMLWDRPSSNSRLAAPLLVDGMMFMVTDGGVGVCVDAASGNELQKIRIGGVFVSSPITANGLIYACNEDGSMTVIRAEPSMEIVARNQLSEGMRASPAAAGGRLYLRTLRHLYCIGQTPTTRTARGTD